MPDEPKKPSPLLQLAEECRQKTESKESPFVSIQMGTYGVAITVWDRQWAPCEDDDGNLHTYPEPGSEIIACGFGKDIPAAIDRCRDGWA